MFRAKPEDKHETEELKRNSRKKNQGPASRELKKMALLARKEAPASHGSNKRESLPYVSGGRCLRAVPRASVARRRRRRAPRKNRESDKRTRGKWENKKRNALV